MVENPYLEWVDDWNMWHKMGKACKARLGVYTNNYCVCWYKKNGSHHRLDGPAYMTKNCLYWCINGRIHKTDGPAYADINGQIGWYLDGKQYSFNKFLKLTPLSIEEKIMIKLRYC